MLGGAKPHGVEPRRPRMAPIAQPATEQEPELNNPEEIISINNHTSFSKDPGLQVGKQLRQH